MDEMFSDPILYVKGYHILLSVDKWHYKSAFVRHALLRGFKEFHKVGRWFTIQYAREYVQ